MYIRGKFISLVRIADKPVSGRHGPGFQREGFRYCPYRFGGLLIGYPVVADIGNFGTNIIVQ
jgi:hypothetical protein